MRKFKLIRIFLAIFFFNIIFLSGQHNSKLGFISPYLSLEKYIVASNSEYEDMFADEVNLEKWNMLAAGVNYQKSFFFAALSFAGLWHDEKSQFLPAFDINLGVNINNFYIYGGKNVSLVRDNYREIGWQNLELSNPIYLGGKYFRHIKNLGLEFGAQVSRGELHEAGKQNFYAYTLSSKLSYELRRRLSPYISFTVEKLDFDDNLSFNVSFGITFGRAITSPGINPRVKVGSLVRVFKPNIYLYPTTTSKIKVTVKPNGRITASIPPYRNGWNVTVSPDGTIENTAGFLFYEADVYLNHSEKGWCVPFSDLTSFFKNILKGFGFNEIEIKDFLDYWTKKLPISSFYAIYPLSAESLEKICPLEIKPSPEKVLRLWLVFNPLAQKKHLDTPKIQSFSRSGFTATEWGGIILKNSNRHRLWEE